MYSLLHVSLLYYYFLFFINYWLPWFSVLVESFIVQLVCLYLLYLFIINNNTYYLLLFLVILTFFFGVFLAVYQLELFTAFLWLVELSVFFVFLLLLFYINVKGVLHIFNLKYIYYFLFLLFCFLFLFSFAETDQCIYSICIFYNDDFYSALAFSINNDFYGLFVSYYVVNILEFIIIGLILLLGSLLCITLFNINFSVRKNNFTTFLKIFNFFNDFVGFFFIRKQSLNRQGFSKEVVRTFKKK